ILLAYETKALLIGEAASDIVIGAIKEMVDRVPCIKQINELRTMHMGPEDVLLVISVDFVDSVLAGEVKATVYELEQDIKNRFPQVKRLFIEIQASKDHAEITALENRRDSAH
ncbi:MAG: hypothetical protein K8F25_07775, partial [Fimbriimonadaceae bacterium]|nr:hypothetical protein [Alphaproteobacteria bacterium]